MKKITVIAIKLLAAAFLLRLYWRWLKYGKSTVGPTMRGHGRIGGRINFVDDSEIVRRRMAWQSIPQLFRWLTPPGLRYLWESPKIPGSREFRYWREVDKPPKLPPDSTFKPDKGSWKYPTESDLKLDFTGLENGTP